MVASPTDNTIDALIQQGKGEEARRRIEEELAREPNNHWLMTQLGVTHYEKGNYREALKLFLDSLEIVADCPLTLWNVAGTLDALGKSALAVPIFTWLLRSKKSPADDPCWESAEWTEALKTDCVYRLGLCLEHLDRRESAEHCFRQYINLLLAGMNGMYSMEEAARHVRNLHHNGKPTQAARLMRQTIAATLEEPGLQAIQGGRRNLPRLSLEQVLAS